MPIIYLFQSTIAIAAAAAVEEPRDAHASEHRPDVYGVNDHRTGVLLFSFGVFLKASCILIL